VTVNGREYVVTVEETTEGNAAAAPPVQPATTVPLRPATLPATAPAPSSADGDEVAQLAGTVVLVDVQVGQGVKQGDRLILMEAMKMKTPVIASRSGTVARVLVKPGDTVEGGQALVTIS
jgi:biotin carboxyl carrier protein